MFLGDGQYISGTPPPLAMFMTASLTLIVCIFQKKILKRISKKICQHFKMENNKEHFSDEDIYFSDEEEEQENVTMPKCTGCPHTQCDELMPLYGTVYVGSYSSFHVMDYLSLVRKYLESEGIKIEYLCRICQDCEICQSPIRIKYERATEKKTINFEFNIEEQQSSKVDESGHNKEGATENLFNSKPTPSNIIKKQFSEMTDEQKKEYFTKLSKKRKKLKKEENERRSAKEKFKVDIQIQRMYKNVEFFFR